ncbi:MAG: hypothetical protein KAR16_12585 [Bacteroidales bacterium]|nr:hypothetical protein [Bacteroidales bacterium]
MITVYAAAAFVILELVSIIVDPLKLPEWTCGSGFQQLIIYKKMGIHLFQ